LGHFTKIGYGSAGDWVSIHVRNLCEGEAVTLPAVLQNTGMVYLIPEWTWVIEANGVPFAIVVASQAHSWIVLWRTLAISPLPTSVPLSWFLEAIPQVFAEARLRGCIGFLTFLADNRPEEVQLARIIASLPGAALLPFCGSMGVGRLEGIE
jgi:hypothetical protein